MSDRLRRVEQMLRRELSGVIIEGELRDPRLAQAAAISVTGVKISADLSSARVYIDVLSSERSVDSVLDALNAGKSAVRARLAKRVKLKRIPALSFHHDESIEHGVAIERVLAELADERKGSDEGSEAPEDDDEEPA